MNSTITTWLKRHPVIAFFVLTFAITWLSAIPRILHWRWGWIAGLGGFVPALAALILTGVNDGRPGIEKLIAQLFRWRVGVQWYLVAVLGPVALVTMAVLLSKLLSGSAQSLDVSRLIARLPAQGLMLVVIGLYELAVVWGEELGWRGYAQPRLQDGYSALVASVIVGLLWGLWHLPVFWIPDSIQYGISIPFFVVASVGYGILYAWIYNSTGGSVLLVCLVHAADNLVVMYSNLFFPSITGEPLPSLLALGAFAAVIIALAGPKRLARVTA